MKKIIYHIYYSYRIIEDYLIGGWPDYYADIWTGITIYFFIGGTTVIPSSLLSRLLFGPSHAEWLLPESAIIIWAIISIILIIYYEIFINKEKKKYFEILSKDTFGTKFKWIMLTFLFRILSFVYAGVALFLSAWICRL